jgi:pimeloyl-ACP methyl ester carboxylesterase
MSTTTRTTSSARPRLRTRRSLIRGIAGALLLALFLLDGATAQTGETEPLGIGMEGYEYPFPVQYHTFRIEGKRARMAYMDVAPDGQPRGTVVLFHGKNFFGGYWEPTIRHLQSSGYRVIAPDQIGFGKSTKPLIDYSFHRLAWLTHRLLGELDVQETAVVGHSMGGMLATRFALMYSGTTSKLVLENPIGLEDYRRKVPYVPTRAITEAILQKTESGIRSDFKTYFTEWHSSYERFVQVHYRWTLSPEYTRFARVAAETDQMI